MRTRALVAALAAQVLIGGLFIYAAVNGFPFLHDDDGAAAAPRAKVDHFDGRRAFATLRAQVELGPRPAGSPASRRLADRLRRALPEGRLEAVPGGLRNVVGRLPGRRPGLLIAAHYDTKDIPGFVGANDGAGGTAAVVELARALRRLRRGPAAPELRFALFDGEESPAGSDDFLRDGLRGSRAYVRAHGREVRGVVLLDFIADRDLSIPREALSSPRLWARLRAAARAVGTSAVFPAATRGPIADDHLPFTQVGIPAIDLIDFQYACFHQACDDLRHVSQRSLDAVGETVFELIRRYRR